MSVIDIIGTAAITLFLSYVVAITIATYEGSW